MDIDTFLQRAPEFRTFRTLGVPNGDTRIQAALDSATRRTDATLFGADTDDAIFYLAAHLLAASPTGKDARLKGEAFVSVYLAERQRLEAIYMPVLGASAISGSAIPACGGWDPQW